MRDLCESAKRGKVCCDDICRGCDITLCGFDKEEYEMMMRDIVGDPDDEYPDYEPPE